MEAVEAVTRVGQGRLTNREAAKLLALSERQLRRLRWRVGELGSAGVLHGDRGRAPAHRLKAALRDQIVKLRQGKYAGFNDQQFTEKLAEDEGISPSVCDAPTSVPFRAGPLSTVDGI